MIKFFRRIRKQLLTENKFSKYLLYAVGEIILVVIGILIALEFNNRNEELKNLKLVEQTITALETELLDNFHEATFVLSFWKTQDSICKKVLLDQLTLEDYRKNDLIGILAANWYGYSPKTENLDFLLDNEKSANKKLQPIIDIAKELEKRKAFLEQQWDIVRTNIEANINNLSSKVSMARLDSISKTERFIYMLSDPDYKKMVELYWIKAESYSDFISRNRVLNMAALSTIKVVQEGYDKQELENLYQTNGMHPFISSDCTIDTFEKNNELRRSYLLGNLSSEIITLKISNDGKVGGSYKLKPYQFIDSRPEYAGLGGDFTAVAEQLDTNGNCIQKFIGVNKGYLLID